MRRSAKAFRCVLLTALSFLFVLNLALANDTEQEQAAKDLDVQSTSTDPEFRGLWITRYEWPSQNPEECKQKIINVFKDMEEANFNAAVFQIRGAAEVLYPSSLEPWSRLVGGKDPGFDPVELAIHEAHKRGIEFHAYINPLPLYASRGGTAPPHSTPEHLYHLHGPDSSEPWVCMDKDGKIMDGARAGYYYLSPGIPEVHAYVRKAIMDVVHRYDVDGIHLDRIRYPGPQYSHDPVSKRRFLGRGNPNRKEWTDWQREQLDKFVNDLYAEIMAEKPQVVVSCSAWGIYNRHNIEGYDTFSSGYHDYYQDTWKWIQLGAMDVLIPMIYWNIPDPKPNYDELVEDFVKGVGKERLIGGQRMYGRSWEPTENIQEIDVTRKIGALGTVIFSYSSAKEKGAFSQLKDAVYQNKAAVPELEWKVSPEHGIILGKVTDEEGQPLADAWVSIKPDTEEPQPRRRRGASTQIWTSSADGRFAFLKVPPGAVKLIVEYDGAQKTEVSGIEVKPGEVRKIKVAVEGAKAARSKLFFHIFRPEDGSETEREVVHLLGRTMPQNKIRIADKDAEVYSTGAFAGDNIPLKLGENKIQIVATDADGKTTTTGYLTVLRKEPKPAPAVTTLDIIEPSMNLSLLPGDVLEIRAKGPTGLQGRATCWGRRVKVPLTETLDENNQSTGNYFASFRIPAGFCTKPSPVSVEMTEKSGCPLFKKKLKTKSEVTVEVWDSSRTRVGETTAEKSAISYGQHYVRLGGPYLNEVPQGTRFEIIGKRASEMRGRSVGTYKVRLSKSLSGWISERNVTMLPEGTPVPHSFFASLSIGGDEKYDTLWIPMRENVVFAITPETDPQNCLFVDLFNTHYATTWISHKSGAKVIGAVTGEQIEDDWLRLRVPLNCKQIWGYWAEKDRGGLRIFIKRPPQIADPPDSPVKGLLFALEAGHGGRGSGAVGLMGTKEKTINSHAADEVRKALEKRGAKTVFVRPGDSNPALSERVEAAIEADADFLITIHANASGSSRGFLSVSGTSTYYKYKHCQLPTKLIYDELLKLGWNEFGVVGNFNYSPLRNTHIPALLVEQAFMSHPYDEARLLEQEYQEAQAEAIVKGMEAFLTAVKE